MFLLTAAEMRALDRATIEGGHATGPELMDRAGHGVVRAMEARFGAVVGMRALVLCGTGNNGGDGYVAARYLKSAGAVVRVAVAGPRAKVAGDAAVHLALLEHAGVTPEFCEDDASLAGIVADTHGWEYAVDALMGTGARATPEGVLATGCEALLLLRARGTRIVAVDLPTGVSADDGTSYEHSVRADLTVTFGHAKRGHFLFPGRECRGVLEVVDIGLLAPDRAGLTPATLSQPEELAQVAPRRDMRAHKGSAGRVLVVGGAMGMAGAVVLAARSASRAGAGYVRVAAPSSLHDVLASQLVEQMPVPCGEGPLRSLTTTAVTRVLEETALADAVALGPGLSRHADTVRFAQLLLPRLERPAVLDADALFAFSPPEHDLATVLARSPAPRVLTPHLGEMARLTGMLPSTLESRRVDVAAEWAKKWNCVLVLKGAPTVIADATGRVSVNPTGNPGMATAGMGDVLTGAIAALLAQKLSPWDATRLAVFAHGLAGDLAEREIGAIGLVAGDVVERLPRAMAMVSESVARR
ncbi:MAG: NAD(P)H-hydrate dehydratase [Candidatus Eisenbacteria bacterium]